METINELSNIDKILALKDRQSNSAMRLQYPGLYPHMVAVTEERIKDNRLTKRRPSVLMRVRDDENQIEIRPQLGSSATGWEVKSVIQVKIKNYETSRSLVLRLDEGGLRMAKWYTKPELNLPLLMGIDAALTPIASDFWKLFTSSSDHCGWCGRGLTDPISRETGIGPECNAGYVQIQRAVEARMESCDN